MKFNIYRDWPIPRILEAEGRRGKAGSTEI